ncbi:MAG: hypothetical protein FWE87_06655, partial [Coriobacteriia bacterium]|nr:hypothetical protein [Coriobacteriia bacterium]
NFALGDDGSTFGAQTSPIDISAPSTAPLNGVTITKISAGSYHSLALDEDGHVWVWGTRSATSPLGDGLTTPAAQGAPKDISIITGSPDHFENATIVEIAASASHSLALDDAGNVWAWGSNGSGQLGLGASVPTSSAWPLNITDLASSLDGIVIDSIAVGNNSSFALSGLNEEGGQSGEIIFINTYEEPVVAVTIDIEKQVSEGAPSVEFEFTLVQTDGEEITPINSTVQITGNGTGSFDLGDLSAGVYTFTITETSGGGYGWSNDEVVRTVTVTVSGNPLDYSVEFDTLDGDIFINSYEEPVVAVFIDIEKQVSEGAPSVEFEFTLVQTDGPEITPFNSTVQITGTGTGSFDLGDLSAGVYTFTITETSGGGIGWTNDEVVRTVTVTVSGNPLDYSVEFDTLDGNIFVNTYEEPVEPPADAVLSLRKVVLDADENSVAVPGTFKVWLYDAKKDPIASFDLVAGAVAIDVAELTLGETYYVMEAKRTGFNLLGYVVAFGGDETWYTTEAIKIDVPEQVSNPVFAVTVVNKVDAKAGPNPVPPKTGDVMSFWPVAVLLVGLAIVVVVASRKRFER